jgi:hypothetical protein
MRLLLPLETIQFSTTKQQPASSPVKFEGWSSVPKTTYSKDSLIMATKPTTSFAQTPAIDALVRQYGSQLQQLDNRQKLAMLAVIARAAYFQSIHDLALLDWSIEDELASEDYDEVIDKPLALALIALDEDTIHDALGLCAALLDQLHGVKL